jgi:hypothetical protein
MSIPEGAFLDTTLRPICFPELGRVYTPAQAKSVGAEQFKKYEYVLYLMAQLSRIVYCDTGVQWEVIEKGLGLSNDVVNKLITYYDSQYASESRISMNSPPGLNGRPMKSYAVKGQPDAMPSSPNFATYISTGYDVTCLLLDASAVKPNPNSILTPNDIIITFKGSSTIQNFIDDAKSMKPTDFSAALKQIELDVPNLGNVAGGFVFPLLHAFKPLMEALAQRLEGKQSPRIFITGHSLGGAYATLFGWILALMKKNGIIQSVKSLHTVTYGAPLLFSDTARNQYNSILDEGLLTLDRVVSQQIASVKTAAAGTLGKMASGADFIPTIPPGFSHPGFQPLITEFFPEKGGRPYGLQNIRGAYGVTNPQSYRNSTTWPFDSPAELGNIGKRTNLASIVSGLTGATASQVAALPNTQVVAPVNTIQPQQGGLFGFGEEKTKYEELTKKHIPNFVSVVGSKWAMAFPHAEYLGMFFAGAMRMAGRKNPVPTGDLSSIATFFFTPQGVDIQYNFKKVGSQATPIAGGRRKQTRKVKKSKKQRRTRKH